MNTNETNTARKLTLEEIESMPRGSVIWRSVVIETHEGIVWHEADPMMICVPGPGGFILGADEAGYYEHEINDQLMDDPCMEYWNYEPKDGWLPGITKDQYNALTCDELITNTKLASVITAKGMTFETFCECAGMDYRKFWSALIGKRDFVQSEIVSIRTALELTDGEVLEIFFPESIPQI